MSGDRVRRIVGRRAEEDGDFSDFYAGFYGADEGSGGGGRPRHRNAPVRGAALFRGWRTLVRRSPLVLALAVVAAGLLVVGVSISATKLGTGSPSLGAARSTGSPSEGPSLVATRAPTPTNRSTRPPSAPTASASVSPPVVTPGSDGGQVGGSTVPGHHSAGVPDGSSPGINRGSTPVAPPPTPTTARTTFTPPPTTSRTFTPPPGPTKICLVPDLLHPGVCLVSGP